MENPCSRCTEFLGQIASRAILSTHERVHCLFLRPWALVQYPLWSALWAHKAQCPSVGERTAGCSPQEGTAGTQGLMGSQRSAPERDSSWEQRDTRRDSPGMKGSLWKRGDWGKPWIGLERQKEWDSGGGVGRHLRQTSCQALWRGSDSTCVFQLAPRWCPCGVMSPSPALLLLVLLRCPQSHAMHPAPIPSCPLCSRPFQAMTTLMTPFFRQVTGPGEPELTAELCPLPSTSQDGM